LEKRAKVRKDKAEPKLTQSKIDIAEPHRNRERRDKADPKETAPRRERPEPIRFCAPPKMDTVEPTRETFRIDKPLPNWKKWHTEQAFPSREELRSEKQDPKQTASITETV
jgi:hypothetical protein